MSHQRGGCRSGAEGQAQQGTHAVLDCAWHSDRSGSLPQGCTAGTRTPHAARGRAAHHTSKQTLPEGGWRKRRAWHSKGAHVQAVVVRAHQVWVVGHQAQGAGGPGSQQRRMLAHHSGRHVLKVNQARHVQPGAVLLCAGPGSAREGGRWNGHASRLVGRQDRWTGNHSLAHWAALPCGLHVHLLSVPRTACRPSCTRAWAPTCQDHRVHVRWWWQGIVGQDLHA